MMWASLLLAGFLSGWWGVVFAYTATPPANFNEFVKKITENHHSPTTPSVLMFHEIPLSDVNPTKKPPSNVNIMREYESRNSRRKRSFAEFNDFRRGVRIATPEMYENVEQVTPVNVNYETVNDDNNNDYLEYSSSEPKLVKSREDDDDDDEDDEDDPLEVSSKTRVLRSLRNNRTRIRTRLDSAREQRRRCRNKGGCRGQNWCPDVDVGNRAYLAPTVFEGKARSMSSLRRPGSNYAVTFEVKQVYKSQPGFQPLQKNDSVRLRFRDKSGPGKSTLCGYYDGSESNNAGNGNNNNSNHNQQLKGHKNDNHTSDGIVRANIKRGKVYLVFVNRVGPRNFTILGEPVIRNKKNEQAVEAVIRPDYVREVTLSELRDSVARIRDRVKLVCRTRGSPPPRVHWLKDGIPLHARRGLRIQHKRRRSKVVITSARLEDSGRYECIAESTSGHRAALAAQLLVAHDTRNPETTTAAWLRQEQPCPIAGDFCMNGGTCLFFETVGEPACRCAEGFTGLRCETKDVISTGSVYNRHRAPFSCKLGLSTSYYC